MRPIVCAVFEAPVGEQENVVKRAAVTMCFNGVLNHHRVELLGSTAALSIAKYTPHAPELPFTLQGHAEPVRFRNI
jgi:hypothetical protein